ncbi:hypothetical protein CYY_005428 [Polysphondylium violaceum]|uniref:Uncharacterized protein n=1 Tax=Polysphondylium violaceum TaxID=133409 RepID=A0A8J4PTT3_9MYCE|nr:hypothetical protein CYY_005428 [Polysphondylium violaceum]
MKYISLLLILVCCLIGVSKCSLYFTPSNNNGQGVSFFISLNHCIYVDDNRYIVVKQQQSSSGMVVDVSIYTDSVCRTRPVFSNTYQGTAPLSAVIPFYASNAMTSSYVIDVKSTIPINAGTIALVYYNPKYLKCSGPIYSIQYYPNNTMVDSESGAVQMICGPNNQPFSRLCQHIPPTTSSSSSSSSASASSGSSGFTGGPDTSSSFTGGGSGSGGSGGSGDIQQQSGTTGSSTSCWEYQLQGCLTVPSYTGITQIQYGECMNSDSSNN